MSAAIPTLNYYHVYAPDLPNAQRVKHSKQHMEDSGPRIQSGFIRVGGGLLAPDAKSSDPDVLQKMVGSFIIVQADSIDAAWDLIKKDVFYTSGEVWDREKIVVTPVYVPFKEVKFD